MHQGGECRRTVQQGGECTTQVTVLEEGTVDCGREWGSHRDRGGVETGSG